MKLLCRLFKLTQYNQIFCVLIRFSFSNSIKYGSELVLLVTFSQIFRFSLSFQKTVRIIVLYIHKNQHFVITEN
jgi:hypothetical protein